MPIRTFTELKIVCGTVDWPTTILSRVPSSWCTCLTSRDSVSSIAGASRRACCSLCSCTACLRVASLTREDMVPYDVPVLLSNEDPKMLAIPFGGLRPSRSQPSSSVSAASNGRVISVSPPSDRRSRDSAVSFTIQSSSGSTVTNEGRRGIISGNPAARCHDRAKLSILLTPPACLNRAENDAGLNDLNICSWDST